MGGSFADKGNTSFNFSYQMIVDVVPNQPVRDMSELRMIFQWPLLANGGVGSGSRVYRTVVAGKLVETPMGSGYYFFQPNQF